ncbi:MAG TPA: hypothetical protein DCZ04_10835, partial [Syntrophorhabdus aromaticivorans]|nr:hypothetical protein [Syntrophorhabdus aromaticivorans]
MPRPDETDRDTRCLWRVRRTGGSVQKIRHVHGRHSFSCRAARGDKMKYDTVQHKKYVGFIGLGAMGSSVTRNLVNADYDLCLYHVRKEAMDSFPETRTMKASSPLDVGNAAEVCFLMVNTYEQCLSVLTGAKGLLSGNRCKTLILLSTAAPQDAVAIGKECQTHGVQLLDCPVSGGTKGAADGTLTLMVA